METQTSIVDASNLKCQNSVSYDIFHYILCNGNYVHFYICVALQSSGTMGDVLHISMQEEYTLDYANMKCHSCTLLVNL